MLTSLSAVEVNPKAEVHLIMMLNLFTLNTANNINQQKTPADNKIGICHTTKSQEARTPKIQKMLTSGNLLSPFFLFFCSLVFDS